MDLTVGESRAQVQACNALARILTAVDGEEASLVRGLDEINVFPLAYGFPDMVGTGRLVLPVRPVRKILEILDRVLPVLVVSMIVENLEFQYRRIETFHFAEVSDEFPHSLRFHILDHLLVLEGLIASE
jgi:hypothetical protein